MIEIERVSKRFQETEALKEVSLSVRLGSIYGLVGSNGAGKTTLLKILAGIYKPDSGTLTIDSQPVFENRAQHLEGNGAAGCFGITPQVKTSANKIQQDTDAQVNGHFSGLKRISGDISKPGQRRKVFYFG
jgi:ABC-type multidrug transport system ATPase subunit